MFRVEKDKEMEREGFYLTVVGLDPVISWGTV